jgi:O-acetyl-ADP-ribose deacetylase (regulator of RNase III)
MGFIYDYQVLKHFLLKIREDVMELKVLCNGRLIVETGDITEKNTDAIVNAANSSLLGGGGVDGTIHANGGPAILEECKVIRRAKYPDGLPTGKAVYTTGGLLSAKYVIHTVGPVWFGGMRGESEQLADAYRNSLILASELHLSTISFPAISTGVYGFPKEEAADIVFDTLKVFIEENKIPETVYLVFFSKDDALLFLGHIKA